MSHKRSVKGLQNLLVSCNLATILALKSAFYTINCAAVHLSYITTYQIMPFGTEAGHTPAKIAGAASQQSFTDCEFRCLFCLSIGV